MGSKAREIGPAGRTVAEQVVAVRTRRGLSQRALSARLAAVGHPVGPSGIAKLETGERGISVDDLLALAAALNVSPARLFLPDHAGDEPVEVTPKMAVPAWTAWAWAEGRWPLPSRPVEEDLNPIENLNSDHEIEDYLSERPADLRREEQQPAARAARDLVFSIGRALRAAPQSSAFQTRMASARRNLDQVEARLSEMEGSD